VRQRVQAHDRLDRLFRLAIGPVAISIPTATTLSPCPPLPGGGEGEPGSHLLSLARVPARSEAEGQWAAGATVTPVPRLVP
jgi:hypothetical protein